MPFVEDPWVNQNKPVWGSAAPQGAVGVSAASPHPGFGIGAPSSIGVGGYTPDYANLLKSNPAYAAWLAKAQQRKATAATNRASAIRSLIARYGGIPDKFKDAFGDIRPEDLTAATDNPFSEQKLLQQHYERSVNDMRRALAARGALQSGDLNYGQGQLDEQRGQGEYQLGQDFLGLLQQALTGYTGEVEGIDAEEPGLIGQATDWAAQNYPAVADQPATLIAGSQNQYGFPVYKDGQGNLWRTNPTTGKAEPFSPMSHQVGQAASQIPGWVTGGSQPMKPLPMSSSFKRVLRGVQ